MKAGLILIGAPKSNYSPQFLCPFGVTHPVIVTVPSLSSLRASALQNNSILVEWELEYDGGHPITLLEVHVALHLPRPPLLATPPARDLVYHVMDGGVERLVTRGVEPGHTYTATATATNTLGPSSEQTDTGT